MGQGADSVTALKRCSEMGAAMWFQEDRLKGEGEQGCYLMEKPCLKHFK